jgi:hypothetical protein
MAARAAGLDRDVVSRLREVPLTAQRLCGEESGAVPGSAWGIEETAVLQ